jgi:hypothetical protein
MAHNFFEPQPITGANVYYLRTVLHDWDDENALVILQRLVPAMDLESLILIDDMAFPDTGAHWWSACLDLHMLAVLGAHEHEIVRSLGGLGGRMQSILHLQPAGLSGEGHISIQVWEGSTHDCVRLELD